MIDPRLDHELVDDVALMETLLNAAVADEGAHVVRELDGETGEKLPSVLYDLDGENLANGPGLWPVILRIWVWADNDSDVWRVAQAVHRGVTSWDVPGNGLVPGVAGVERASILQKFRGVWDTKTPTRLLRESIAQYELLVRVY